MELLIMKFSSTSCRCLLAGMQSMNWSLYDRSSVQGNKYLHVIRKPALNTGNVGSVRH